jgi:hypothetical protein
MKSEGAGDEEELLVNDTGAMRGHPGPIPSFGSMGAIPRISPQTLHGLLDVKYYS